MKFNRLFAAAAGAALVTVSTGAVAAPVANPAASLSVAPARAGAPTTHGSGIGASVPTTALISIGILAAIVVVLLVAVKNDDNGASTPTSP
jgi:hypothetical protein